MPNPSKDDLEAQAGGVADASETSSQVPNEKKVVAEDEEEKQYPGNKIVVPLMIALYLSVFLVAIDRTIIGTAIPAISDEFKSFSDIGWYGSGYLLTLCAFQLLTGRIYTYFAPKWIFMASILIFEVGSIVCAAAPSSAAFIVGRAVAGAGSAGIFSGSIILMVGAVPLRKRPMYQGLFGAIFGVASVLGPLVGGAFTTNVTWRWCFWINVPIGGVTMFILLFILRQQPAPAGAGMTLRQKLIKLDPIGTIILLPAIICLLLALQWGGSTYAWSSGRIIALLVVGIALLVVFVGIQIWQKDSATIPPRILANRSITAGFLSQTCIGSAMMMFVYYLPVWFQAIKNDTAIQSGIATLPLVLGLVVFSIVTGILVSKLGYYTPPMILGTVIMSIAAGLITTFRVDTGHSAWIGYQCLFGFGLGMCMQQANIAAQTVLPRKDVPVGVSLMWFGQSFGGAIFISVAQSVLQNKLIDGLGGIPAFDPHKIATAGATELRGLVPPQYLDTVLLAYNGALVQVFYAALGLSLAAFVLSCFMEFKSVKDAEKK